MTYIRVNIRKLLMMKRAIARAGLLNILSYGLCAFVILKNI